MKFQPKEGGPDWTASMTSAIGTGYDLSLFLDRADGITEDSGWMIEMGIEADGTVCGQITAHPGYDALAVFGCTQTRLTFFGNSPKRPILCAIDKDQDLIVPGQDAVRAALQALLDWGRDHTSPTDPNSPHELLVAAAKALEE